LLNIKCRKNKNRQNDPLNHMKTWKPKKTK
jgi:hypothetical protein